MPSPLAAQIQGDLVSALKNRDEVRLSVLRMLKASMQVAVTEKGRSGDLSDDDVQSLIRRAIKQREEAAEQYRKADANERAAEELEEAEVLKAYLPTQMDDLELESLVARVVRETGASGPKDMGRVMGKAVQEASGKADGKRVKDTVTKLLRV